MTVNDRFYCTFYLIPNRREDRGDIGLAADLATIQDDVVGDEEGEDTETETPANQGVSVMRSAPTNRIFIEQKGKCVYVDLLSVHSC